MPSKKWGDTKDKLDRVVAQAQQNRTQREQGYRQRALKLYPWVCGRCAREFTQSNVHELTVHHRDHNHDNNPENGSNWELLCLYCHDNEHSRLIDGEYLDNKDNRSKVKIESATHQPFAGLSELLTDKKN